MANLKYKIEVRGVFTNVDVTTQSKTILKTEEVNRHELATKKVLQIKYFGGELIETVEVLVTTIFGKFLNVILSYLHCICFCTEMATTFRFALV